MICSFKAKPQRKVTTFTKKESILIKAVKKLLDVNTMNTQAHITNMLYKLVELTHEIEKVPD